METDIKELIVLQRKAMNKADELLSDCPDKEEGRRIAKARREMETAMEFIVMALNYQRDKLDPRFK